MSSDKSKLAPTSAWSTLEPYAQLLRSLLPRTEDIWVFDAAIQLRWTTESMTGPDLPQLVEASQNRAQHDIALPGEVVVTNRDAAPVYLWWLRTDAGEMLATVAVAVRPGISDGHMTEITGGELTADTPVIVSIKPKPDA
jgi:hypothetical protein